jgi:hypothetical protein
MTLRIGKMTEEWNDQLSPDQQQIIKSITGLESLSLTAALNDNVLVLSPPAAASFRLRVPGYVEE